MEKCSNDTSTDKYAEDRVGDGISDNLPKDAIVPLSTPMERQLALQAALKNDPGVKRWSWAAIQVSNTFYSSRYTISGLCDNGLYRCTWSLS